MLFQHRASISIKVIQIHSGMLSSLNFNKISRNYFINCLFYYV